MSVLTVIKKIGDKVISVVEYPFKRAAQVMALLGTVQKEYPATAAAFAGMVQELELLGEDAIAALAAKGLDVPEDLKVTADVQAFFAYVKNTVFPAIDADYLAIKSDLGPTAATVMPAPDASTGVTTAEPATTDATTTASPVASGVVSGAPLAAD